MFPRCVRASRQSGDAAPGALPDGAARRTRVVYRRECELSGADGPAVACRWAVLATEPRREVRVAVAPGAGVALAVGWGEPKAGIDVDEVAADVDVLGEPGGSGIEVPRSGTVKDHLPSSRRQVAYECRVLAPDLPGADRARPTPGESRRRRGRAKYARGDRAARGAAVLEPDADCEAVPAGRQERGDQPAQVA